MADRILVPFEGEGAGVGEMTWGQRELWGGMVRQRSWMPLAFVRPLPPGTTVGDVAAELCFVMSRHQSMRTLLRMRPDGPPCQVLHGRGEVALEIVHADDADPAQVAEQTRQRLWDTEYDFEREWPVRTAVVVRDGVPTHQVTVSCHLVSDAFGAIALAADLTDRDPATGAARHPVTAMQPLEQAAWQQSEAGRQQCEAVLRYWEGILRAITPRRFPEQAGRFAERARFWRVDLRSRAAFLAIQAIAARTGTDPAPVILTVFARALCRVTGIDPVVTRVVVSNRFRRGLADTVSPISQTGLLVLDVAGVPFDEALERVRRRTMAAYKYAYYDPLRMDALVDRVARERGEEVDIACFYNDRRLSQATVAKPTAEQVRAALPETSIREEPLDKPNERLFVHINDVPDALDVTIFADTHHLSLDQMRACAQGMEDVAVGGC
jgi:hypothetical protein